MHQNSAQFRSLQPGLPRLSFSLSLDTYPHVSLASVRACRMFKMEICFFPSSLALNFEIHRKCPATVLLICPLTADSCEFKGVLAAHDTEKQSLRSLTCSPPQGSIHPAWVWTVLPDSAPDWEAQLNPVVLRRISLDKKAQCKLDRSLERLKFIVSGIFQGQLQILCSVYDSDIVKSLAMGRVKILPILVVSLLWVKFITFLRLWNWKPGWEVTGCFVQENNPSFDLYCLTQFADAGNRYMLR